MVNKEKTTVSIIDNYRKYILNKLTADEHSMIL